MIGWMHVSSSFQAVSISMLLKCWFSIIVSIVWYSVFFFCCIMCSSAFPLWLNISPRYLYVFTYSSLLSPSLLSPRSKLDLVYICHFVCNLLGCCWTMLRRPSTLGSILVRLCSSPATHNVFKTLLESCAEQTLQQPCSNVWPNICRVAITISNIKRCYNVAAMLFGNIQRCSNVIWQHLHHFRSKLPLNVVATLTDPSWITFSQLSFNLVETLLQP